MPIKFRSGGSLRPRSRNPEVLKTAAYNGMKRLMKDAIEQYIRAAIEKMHVDTGMSVNTFGALAAHLRLKSAIFASIKGGGPKTGHTSVPSYVNVPGDNVAPTKSAGLGKRLGQQAYIVSFGDRNNAVMDFTFSIVSLQHYLHEFGVRGGNPWNSLEAGRAAFLEFIQQNGTDYLPNINEFLLNGRIIHARG